ncbi:MAG TPA: DNA repair protein RecN [Candidatus Baltobacteraceae bacterium]|jgi:DNA repair protein RecN (Recombination protein N)
MALRRLTVEDYELIAHAELEPAAGLTAITGETGSGKTMLLAAIDFALGARAATDAVRKGRKRARISLEIEPDARTLAAIAAAGIEIDEDETLAIVRELSEGKTSARVGGVPVSAAQLRTIGREVAEIVGQHEAQRLLVPAQQLEALDRFGGAELLATSTQLRAAHERHASVVAELAGLEAQAGRALADADYATFASREIADAAPETGEEERLRERRDLLVNAERIASALRAAHDALIDGETSASDSLGAAATSLSGVGRYARELEELASAASTLQSETSELSARLARQLESVDVDPAELDSITGRLELLDRLKKKYGGSVGAVLEAKQRFDETTKRFENADEHRASLQRARDDAAIALRDAAAKLTKLRQASAKTCEKKISTELAALAMPSARFEIAFETLEQIGPRGAERCEFMLAANPGEPARSLGRSASGGELSRVMLALTVVLADRSARTAIIFDEIDAGVGGATANAVGARLADLARDLQVVCVTHLAQIAAYADRQVALRKTETKSATLIEIVDLDRDARLEELARMLSGATTGVSLQHARTLLKERKAG